jgi:hypothetical protein
VAQDVVGLVGSGGAKSDGPSGSDSGLIRPPQAGVRPRSKKTREGPLARFAGRANRSKIRASLGFSALGPAR